MHNKDNVTQDGITAYGTLIWIDNFGPLNELYGVSGQWVSRRSDFSNWRQVDYGSTSGNYRITYPTINCIYLLRSRIWVVCRIDFVLGYAM